MAFCGCTNVHPLMKHLKFNSVYRYVNTSSVYYGFTGFKISDKLHSRQVAQDFIFKLSHRERTILLEELQRFQAQANAIRDVGKIPPPTSAQLRALAAHSAMPFIGFGFLDNVIMILAGDYIDTTIGITLGISTMAGGAVIYLTVLHIPVLLYLVTSYMTVAHLVLKLFDAEWTLAAGMGNTLSDIAGIGSAWYVERIAYKVGVQAPSLTAAQIAMSRSRWTVNLGRALGVTIGCLLGMFPLLFRKNKDPETDKNK